MIVHRPISVILLGWGLALSGCTGMQAPEVKPTRPPAVRPATPEPRLSEESAALKAYYKRVESSRLAKGLLRKDNGGTDTPYTDTNLIRNFTTIALQDEYVRNGGLQPASSGLDKIKKWATPVRIGVEFDDYADADMRRRDRKALQTYIARLADVTGHQISLVESNPNFLVLIAGEDSREASLAKAQELIPNLSLANRSFFLSLPKDFNCFVLVAGNANSPHRLNRAVALIRAENTDLQREACIHEELAQGLGLTNDSPRARPSIFNDDDEFAFLTTHDEELLRILYNPDIKPGMDAETARPIVRRIVAERYGPV